MVCSQFPHNMPQTPTHRFPILTCVSIALGLACTGCNPDRYAGEADAEVAMLLGERVEDADWKAAALAPMEAETSRLFEFGNVEDDQGSAKILGEVAGRKLPMGWAMPDFQPDGKWLEALPKGEDGKVVLDLASAVDVGVRNSRDFQLRREALYLSALDVTGERFLFKPRVSAGAGLDRGAQGADRGGPSEDASSSLDAQLRLGLVTGGEFIANLANTFLWDISGDGGEHPSSLLGFRFVQPLMRGGWRAIALEDLAQAERNFLANIRRMYQYQQSYYVEVVAGRRLAGGPTRGGGGIGSVAGGSGSSGSAGGFLGLLQDRQQIRNLEASVARLRDSHDQLAAAFEAGRINNRLQVDQAQQALYNAQSRLLQERSRQASSQDRFKMDLGLPPGLEVRLEADVLDRFELVDPSITALQDEVGTHLDRLRQAGQEAPPALLRETLAGFLTSEAGATTALQQLDVELEELSKQLPKRKAQMESLGSREDLKGVGLDAGLFTVDTLDAGLEKSRQNLKNLGIAFTGTWAALKQLAAGDELARAELLAQATALSGLLLELSLEQAAIRLESIQMVDVEMETAEALEIARENRMDWMNARAGLHDEWRRTGIFKDALRSSFDFVRRGDVRSQDGTSDRFNQAGGILQGGVRLDTPLTKLQERNNYKAALIRFEQAKRDYVEFEDSVELQLRETLRTIRLEQLNFELKRAAVRVAIAQVDLARLRLNRPPQPGKGGQFGATTARDLVDALSDLLDAQNNFLNAWVGYEVLRMVLDFQLGTMQVDQDNLWVDPGAVGKDVN